MSDAKEPRIPYDWEGTGPPGYFDKTAAEKLIGKYVLIGVTYADESGKEVEHFQMHGIIETAAPTGIKVSLRGTRAGRSWTMPPNLRGLAQAKPGRYTLSETGEIVENPDLMVVWTVAKPAPKATPQGS